MVLSDTTKAIISPRKSRLVINPGGLGLRAINTVIGVRHKMVSLWIAEAPGNLPENRAETEAFPFIEVD